MSVRRGYLALTAAAFVAMAGCSLWIDGERFADSLPDAAPGQGSEPDAGSRGPGIDAAVEPADPDAAPAECSAGCADCGDGCCTETCAGDCQLECDSSDCECNLDCAATSGVCDVKCKKADCSIDCRQVDECKPKCEMDSSCTIDCTGAGKCDKAECTHGASCLLDCTGADSCRFMRCEGELTSCPGDILACNRECP